MIALASVGAVIAVVVLSVISTYNRFVRQRQFIDNSWSTVETELVRRYELVPNLVATVKAYADHERETLEAVLRARAAALADHGSPDHQAETENVLVVALGRLLAVSEAYPDLKADERFADLQHELVITEDRIQAARRLFNRNVRDYNTRVEQIPTNLIARVGRFERADYVEIVTVASELPAVGL
jgi:LemA protein